MPRPLIVANWKMHKQAAEGSLLARAIAERARATPLACDIVLCPPATLLHVMAPVLGQTTIALGGQDCHSAAQGPHTGDIAATMLADAGAAYVILGHSERRVDHGESNAIIRAKAIGAIAAGLTPIICVGETAQERQANQAMTSVSQQLHQSFPAPKAPTGIAIAYEPLWAIGSGQTPSAADIQSMHATIGDGVRHASASRAGEDHQEQRPSHKAGDPLIPILSPPILSPPILYGGSVKADNAADILAIDGVDGLLVGGASLEIDQFWPIVMAAHSVALS